MKHTKFRQSNFLPTSIDVIVDDQETEIEIQICHYDKDEEEAKRIASLVNSAPDLLYQLNKCIELLENKDKLEGNKGWIAARILNSKGAVKKATT